MKVPNNKYCLFQWEKKGGKLETFLFRWKGGRKEKGEKKQEVEGTGEALVRPLHAAHVVRWEKKGGGEKKMETSLTLEKEGKKKTSPVQGCFVRQTRALEGGGKGGTRTLSYQMMKGKGKRRGNTAEPGDNILPDDLVGKKKKKRGKKKRGKPWSSSLPGGKREGRGIMILNATKKKTDRNEMGRGKGKGKGRPESLLYQLRGERNGGRGKKTPEERLGTDRFVKS